MNIYKNNAKCELSTEVGVILMMAVINGVS